MPETTYQVKKITELSENVAANDTDLYVIGNNGTATMRKVTFANLANWVKAKVNALTTSDVVNNATSTTTDKPASAAVAKSLQDQITALNSSTSTTSSVVTRLYFAKTGQLVTMSTGAVITARTWSAYETLEIGTAPTGYRPAREVNFAVPATDRSITLRLIVQPGGNVRIYNPGGAISTSVGVVVAGATYSTV